MARVTIEDCVKHIPNRFLLVQAAVRRARQLIEGSKPLVQSKNREGVVALREIAAEKVRPNLDASVTALPGPTPYEGEGDEALLEATIEEVSVAQMASDAGPDPTDALEGPSGEADTPEPEPQAVDADDD